MIAVCVGTGVRFDFRYRRSIECSLFGCAHDLQGWPRCICGEGERQTTCSSPLTPSLCTSVWAGHRVSFSFRGRKVRLFSACFIVNFCVEITHYHIDLIVLALSICHLQFVVKKSISPSSDSAVGAYATMRLTFDGLAFNLTRRIRSDRGHTANTDFENCLLRIRATPRWCWSPPL